MAARKVTKRTDLATAISKMDSSLTAATAAGKAIAGAEHKAEQSAAARRAAYAKHAPTITAYVMAGGKASTLAAAIAGVPTVKAQRDAKAQAAFQAMEKRIQRWDAAGRLIASHPVKDDDVRDAMVKLANGLTREEATALANSAKWTPAATDTVANVRKYAGKPGSTPGRKPRKPGKPGKPASNPPQATNPEDGATIATALAKLAARVRTTGEIDPNHDAIMKAMKAYADAHNAAIKKAAA